MGDKLPAVGSRWLDADGAHTRVVRVMAVADGWIMARRSGCIPFCTYHKDWSRRFLPAYLPEGV